MYGINKYSGFIYLIPYLEALKISMSLNFSAWSTDFHQHQGPSGRRGDNGVQGHEGEMGNPGEEGKILQIVPLWFVYYQCVWIV